MEHQRFTGIAYADSLGFGIENNINGHIKIRALIHENMAVSRTGLDDWNTAVLHYGTDESCTTSGNQHIHILVHFHEFLYGLTAGIFNQLYRIFRNFHIRQRCTDHLRDRTVREKCVTSAAENHHISCLKAESKGICRYVWSGFIDHTDDAQWYFLPANHQAVGTLFHGSNFPYRVWQRCHLTNSFCHTFDPVVIQHQAVNHPLGHPICSGFLHVFYIFCQNKSFLFQ